MNVNYEKIIKSDINALIEKKLNNIEIEEDPIIYTVYTPNKENIFSLKFNLFLPTTLVDSIEVNNCLIDIIETWKCPCLKDVKIENIVFNDIIYTIKRKFPAISTIDFYVYASNQCKNNIKKPFWYANGMYFWLKMVKKHNLRLTNVVDFFDDINFIYGNLFFVYSSELIITETVFYHLSKFSEAIKSLFNKNVVKLIDELNSKLNNFDKRVIDSIDTKNCRQILTDVIFLQKDKYKDVNVFDVINPHLIYNIAAQIIKRQNNSLECSGEILNLIKTPKIKKEFETFIVKRTYELITYLENIVKNSISGQNFSKFILNYIAESLTLQMRMNI